MKNQKLKKSSNEIDIKNKSRRSFLKKASFTAAVMPFMGSSDLFSSFKSNQIIENANQQEKPWFQRITRWGQTNITEMDPKTYDIDWWRQQWKKTQTQGLVISAGGIVAYYPTKIPLHYQSKYLNGRDLFGDLCKVAHEDGLAVFARMDSNRANEDFYKAHPDWFSIDSEGKPYRAGDLYITCVNSPYYQEHIPSILTEIAHLYQPEGFTDNSWSGLGRDSICYCNNCKEDFRKKTGNEIPLKEDWDSSSYRKWIRWNYDRRLEIWDLNNYTTKKAGGPNCIWSGMNSGSISNQSRTFRDYKEICKRADIIMMDHQSRPDSIGLQSASDIGKVVHGLLGWDKLIPNSMAMYQTHNPTFRVSSKPVAEAHMWMIECFAGGIQPWWHHVAAYHDDRRMYHTAEPIYRWYKINEDFMINRTPVSSIGVVWSQENTDFYGRNDANMRVDQPWNGIIQALIRARIPYKPVHADHIDREASKLSLLILPNFGSMTEKQVLSIKRFVQNGGNLFATGESSLYDESGNSLKDYALNELFGAHFIPVHESDDNPSVKHTRHTYLRLTPELRSNVYGPQTGDEPVVLDKKRHSVLKGFDQTDILPFGGELSNIRVDENPKVIMTYIPEFPIYPPETAWMRESKTNIPGLILNTLSNGSHVAFMPADIDRQFSLHNLPDHGDLIENIVRWTSKEDIPLSVEGAGLINCNIYEQENRMILHLTNLTNSSTWRAPMDEYIPIGPVSIKIKLSQNIEGETLNLLVAGQKISAKVENGWSHFQINSILNHEVIVIA